MVNVVKPTTSICWYLLETIALSIDLDWFMKIAILVWNLLAAPPDASAYYFWRLASTLAKPNCQSVKSCIESWTDHQIWSTCWIKGEKWTMEVRGEPKGTSQCPRMPLEPLVPMTHSQMFPKDSQHRSMFSQQIHQTALMPSNLCGPCTQLTGRLELQPARPATVSSDQSWSRYPSEWYFCDTQ